MSKQFVPSLFIDIGETGAYFTLRETYEHISYLPGEGDSGNSIVNGVYQGTVQKEIRSFHHFNLSQDPDEAVAKAQEYAERSGLKLDASADTLRLQMRDINRANAEELERRAAARVAEQEFWRQQREAQDAARREKLLHGIVDYSHRFQDTPIEEVDPGYLAWLVSKLGEFEAGSFLRFFAETVRDRFAHLLPREPKRDLYVGEVGKRQAFEVEVLRVHSFSRPKFNAPWTTESVHIVTMITPEGACLVSKGSFFARAGDVLKIKATVKEHDEYNGQAQTVVQRLAVLGD